MEAMNRLKAVLSPASGYEDVLQYSLDTMGSWYTLKIASNLFFLLWIEYLKVILDSSHHIRMVLLRSWICVSAMCLLSMVAVRLSRSRIGKILFDRAAPRQVWLVCGYFIILAAAWSATHVGFEWNADTKDSLLQYGLEIPLDVSQLLFWNSFNFPLPWTCIFTFLHFIIQFVRLSSIEHELGASLYAICVLLLVFLSVTIVLSSNLTANSIQIAYRNHCAMETASQQKHKMVHLLCSVVLAPIHTILESIKLVSNIPKAWTKKIVLATNQVSLQSNNYLMLIKIEEGRFKFTCTNTVDVPALVSSVLDRLPCAGDSTSSPTGTIQVNQHVETRMILCDSKALSFVLENSLTYAINIIRRKVKEMQGKLRRQVPCSEFRAVEISVDSMSRKHKEGAQGPPDCLVIRITFGAHNSIPQSSLNVALRKLSPAYEVNVETILPEWECTSYGTPKNRKTGGRTRLSTILLTAKQMLGSCGGSVQLFEVPVGQDRDPGGVVSVIDLKVPCVLRDDLATTVVRSDDTQLDHVKGSFDMGFLIKDNEFYAYGLRLFRMCNVRCCRISDPSDRDSIHNYAAIVTDSLNTYARLRVQGYRGKVIVMSAAAVYIDGSSTRQTCDYVLPVPCQLSEVKDVVSSLSNDKVIQSKLKTIRPKTRPIEAFLRKHTDIPIVYFLLMVKSFLRRWYIACTHNLQELGAFFRSRITDSDKNESQLGHHFDTDQSVWCSPFINRRVEAEFFESRLLSTVGGVITPRCSVLGILKLIEFVVLASIHPQSTHWLLPNLLTAVLILSVYAFNFEWVRGRIALTTYWNSAAMIVVGLSFFQAMTLVVSLATVFREEMSSHNFRYNMCGEYSCLQALCLVLFYPLMAHTLWTLGFGLRMAIALLMMYCAITITSLILVAPKLDLNWPVVALLLVVALFTVSAVFAMIQCEQWQRIAFQNSKRSNFSLKFISKCTELVWKELRNPLNTVLDYHEEYMKYIAKCISAQSVQMTPSLMQCLTSYRLGNLVLHEIQTVLKLKESLDSDGCREELRNRRHLEYAIKDEIHNLGRVFETESPLCIKVYIRICKSIPNRVKLDKEICQTVLVHSMSQAVNCIKTLVNNHPRAEDVCRRAIESLGGVFTRRQYAHHVYQNMVSFSLPVEFLSDAKGHPTSPFCRNIHQGYRQSGGRYALLLDKYIQRNSGKVGKVPKSFRNISPANPTCKILIAVSGQVSIISNCFRIQGWDCWEVSCHQQILSFDALDEMDVVLVEKEVDIKFMQANGGRTIAAAIKEAFPDVCMVSFVNNKPSNIGDYDAVVSRPFVDADVENIFKTCNSLAIRTLLWIQ